MRKIACASAGAGAVLVAWAALAAAAGPVVDYPQGYRAWTHVKTALVGPASPSFKQVGGFHHIYANPQAVEGYRTGKFPQGAMLVFDVLQAQDDGKGTTSEGPRRHIDVMQKDSAKFAVTGGWGYGEFRGDSQTERPLDDKAIQACHTCHATAKADSVFSKLRK